MTIQPKKLETIEFANGKYPLPSPGFRVRATKTISDGDWKTAAIHGPRELLSGEEMIVDQSFTNFDGFWLQGTNPRGQLVSVQPCDVELIADLGEDAIA